MKLAKAIEINQDIKRRGSMIDDPDDNNAIQLGIEAMKLVKANRDPELPIYSGLLPGETEN